MKKLRFKSYEVLGATVHPFKIDELNDIILTLVRNNEKKIIGNHNLHSIYLFHSDSVMRQFYSQSFINHIDGMPIIFWLKALGKQISTECRITYVDLIHPLMQIADNNQWKIYYLGSKPGVADKASKILNKKYQDVDIETHHGFFEFNSEKEKEILQEINNFHPQLLLVGMGMPRQERWILNNIDSLNSNVIMNSGACFDYIAGEQKTPPRLLGKIGMEWLYRLVSDPKRLSKRYLIEPLSLTPHFIRDLKNSYYSRSQKPS